MALVQAAPGTVLITGTTSGVGLYATKSLVETIFNQFPSSNLNLSEAKLIIAR